MLACAACKYRTECIALEKLKVLVLYISYWYSQYVGWQATCDEQSCQTWHVTQHYSDILHQWSWQTSQFIIPLNVKLEKTKFSFMIHSGSVKVCLCLYTFKHYCFW